MSLAPAVHCLFRHGVLLALWLAFIGMPVLAYDLHKAVPARLLYGASKFFISAETEVVQQVTTAAQARSELQPPGMGTAVEAGEDGVFRVSLTSEILGIRSQFHAWLNSDARILQRTSLYTGRKNWYRNYRFTEDGAYSIKRWPVNDEESSKFWSAWSSTAEDHYVIGEASRHLPLSEAEAIFYLVNVADLQRPGDTVVQPLFDKTGAIKVTLSVQDRVPVDVDFRQFTTSGEERVRGTIDSLHVLIVCRPFAPDSTTDDFKFLGYKGDVDFYIDPVRRIMVKASGRIDYLGQIDILLKEADFRSV